MGVHISTAQANISLKPNPHKIPDAIPQSHQKEKGITGLRILSAGSTPRAPCTGPGDPSRSASARKHSPTSFFFIGVHGDPRVPLSFSSSFDPTHVRPASHKNTRILRQPWVLTQNHLLHARSTKSARILPPVREPAGEVDIIWINISADDSLRHVL